MPLDSLAHLDPLDLATLAVLLLAGLSILAWTLITGVPPMPTPRPVRRAMLDMIPARTRPAVVHELGCGWGHLAFALARRYPEARVVAWELSPLPWAVARLLSPLARHRNLRVRYGNFMKHDLGEADLVACYLMPGSMPRLQAKLAAELKPGAVVVSGCFAMPDWRPDDVRVLPEAMNAWVYRYRAPGQGSAGQGSAGQASAKTAGGASAPSASAAGRTSA